MFKARLLLIVLLILAGLVSVAKIRVILNGGGLAEMMYLSSMHQLEDFLSLASNRPDIFGLDDSESRALRVIQVNEIDDVADAEIEFFVGTRNGQFVEYGGNEFVNKIWVSSDLLYGSDDRPLPLEEIVEVAARQWLQRPLAQEIFDRQGIDNLTVGSLTKKLVKSVVIEKSSVYVGELLGTRFLYDLIESYNIKTLEGLEVTASLFLETELASYDLSSSVVKAMACGSGVAKVLEFSQSAVYSERLQGQVKWTCGSGELKSARYLITFPDEVTQETMENDLQVRLVQVREISACEKITGASAAMPHK